TGSAARPAAYESGIENVDGTFQLFTKEIRPAAGNAEEWTKLYSDFLGRPARLVRSDGASRQFFYNAAGQLRKVRDLDGRSTLFSYNQKGEREYTALDVDNSDTIDLAGDDRVARVLRDVVNGRKRTRTFTWPQRGRDEPLLSSTVETSFDG